MDNQATSEAEYIRIHLNHPNMKDIKFYAGKDKFVQEGKVLGVFAIEGKEHKIESPVYGKILKIDIEDREIIIEPCKHEKLYFNLCSDCSFNTK
jgi:hypothetical protein